jgi:bacillithiol biosynthesis deacetylase BshB1
MKINILAFAAHPDDAELACSGTLFKHIKKGYKAGIIDLTRGELGTRGDVNTRDKESEVASKILGIHVRENLNLADGFFRKDKASILKIITAIRKFQPDIVLCNAITDRHVDHGRGGDLVAEAAFLSGLRKIETKENNLVQEAWRPKAVYHYIQDRFIKPDFVIDITEEFKVKMQSILAYSSQFFNPNSTEPETPISSKEFLDFIEARAAEFGHSISVKYGEGFNVQRPLGVNNLMDLF